jgi:hypothetical protein
MQDVSLVAFKDRFACSLRRLQRPRRKENRETADDLSCSFFAQR